MTTADPLQEAVSGLREALENAGANPVHHRLTMQRHRQEWPTLWAAIYHVLGAATQPIPRLCGAVNGWVESPAFVCNLPAGHTGNHKDSHPTSGGSVSWPNRTDADWGTLVLEQQRRAERAEATARDAHKILRNWLSLFYFPHYAASQGISQESMGTSTDAHLAAHADGLR